MRRALVALLLLAAPAGCLGFGDDGDGGDTNGAASFRFTPEALGVAGRVVALGHLDGDTVFDVVTGGPDGFTVHRGQGAVFAALAAPACDCAARAIAIGDLHEDEVNDVVVLTDDGVLAYRNDGNATLTAAGTIGAVHGQSLALVDVENDGDLDVVVGGDAGVTLLLNDNATFDTTVSAADTSARTFTFVFVDDDMLLDLVVAADDGLHIFMNDGNASFAPVAVGADVGGVDARTIHPFDVENDQRMDLLVVGDGGTDVLVNTGRLNFRSGDVELPTAAGRAGVAGVAADLDNDGWQDLVVIDAAGVTLFHSDNGTAFSAQRNDGWPAGEALAVADLDRDGRVDVASVGESATTLLRNEGTVGRWTSFLLHGNESAATGTGVKLTLSTGTTISMRQTGGTGSPTIAVPVDPHFGLGGDIPSEYNVAILWPSGILQFETPPSTRLIDDVVPARESMSEAPWEGC